MALESGCEKALGSASAIDSRAADLTEEATNSTIHSGGEDDDVFEVRRFLKNRIDIDSKMLGIFFSVVDLQLLNRSLADGCERGDIAKYRVQCA